MIEKSTPDRNEQADIIRIFSNTRIYTHSNNKAYLEGVIHDELHQTYCTNGYRLYRTKIRCPRYSRANDIVPLVISEELLYGVESTSLKGKPVRVFGTLYSENRMGDDGKTHVHFYVYARKIVICESMSELKQKQFTDIVFLEGYVCKPVIARKTPAGKDIADICLAVERNKIRKDYIQCIAWDENAISASAWPVRKKVAVYGRMESRLYYKRISKDSEDGEYRVAYELSIFKIGRRFEIVK